MLDVVISNQISLTELKMAKVMDTSFISNVSEAETPLLAGDELKE